MLKRNHFSKVICRNTNSMLNYGTTLFSNYSKPAGLWYGVDNGWEEWCLAADNLSGVVGRYEHDVKLKPEANILVIATIEGLREFDAKYRNQVTHTPDEMLVILGDLMNDFDALIEARDANYKERSMADYINWAAVQEDYDGIELVCNFDPRWEDEFMWYCSWDCDSGCIWNTDVVEISLVSSTPYVADESRCQVEWEDESVSDEWQVEIYQSNVLRETRVFSEEQLALDEYHKCINYLAVNGNTCRYYICKPQLAVVHE